MRKDIEFELSLPGLNALMKSPEMQGVINGAAAQIAAAAGEGYETEAAHPIGFVAIGSVYAATWRAKRDNAKNNTLETAAKGARI